MQRFTHVATNLAQLIRLNSVKFKRGDDVSDMRHFLKNEQPFPVAIALLVYTTTRKKCLVNQLAHGGLRVKYNRVKNINKSVAIQLCGKYQNDDIVCPPKLQQGHFTTSATDNCCMNFSSNTAVSSLHGTTISVFRHPEESWIDSSEAFCISDNSGRAKQ